MSAKPKKKLYETLGVNPDATPAELKRARRQRAEQVHPDKQGGSEQEMREVNHAYDVLSDPTTRLLYDQTGEDSRPPEEQRIQGLILQSFMDALVNDAPNILVHARKFIENAKANIAKQKSEGTRALKSLKDRRDKITTKSPVNAFHLIVDQKITQIEQTLAGLDNDSEMCTKALEELKSYTSEEKMIEVVQFQWGGSAATGSQGW